MTADTEAPRRAATVIVLRDTDSGIKILLLRRNDALIFAGGYWVFPGGAIDASDIALAEGHCDLSARHAACREAREEAGIDIIDGLAGLVSCGRWIGPKGETRRYSTEYFLHHFETNPAVEVDGSEILEHRWLSAKDALNQNLTGKMPLYPPTWFTLRQLSRFQRVKQSIEAISQIAPLRVLPVFCNDDGRKIALFEGDAGYRESVARHHGPRHRLWQQGADWHYEYEGVDPGIRPLDGRDLVA